MFNIDKRILAELREECLEIERNGANELADDEELPAELRELFDAVVVFATDDETAQIDAFFGLYRIGTQLSAGQDRKIRNAIKQVCVESAQPGSRSHLAARLGFRVSAVAFRASDRMTDDKTLKALSDFAQELSEEEDVD